jgi:hypothetical protein
LVVHAVQRQLLLVLRARNGAHGLRRAAPRQRTQKGLGLDEGETKALERALMNSL